jgi:hypothetical protein
MVVCVVICVISFGGEYANHCRVKRLLYSFERYWTCPNICRRNPMRVLPLQSSDAARCNEGTAYRVTRKTSSEGCILSVRGSSARRFQRSSLATHENNCKFAKLNSGPTRSSKPVFCRYFVFQTRQSYGCLLFLKRLNVFSLLVWCDFEPCNTF